MKLKFGEFNIEYFEKNFEFLKTYFELFKIKCHMYDLKQENLWNENSKNSILLISNFSK